MNELSALRTYFQVEPRDEPRKIREKVTGKLLSLDRALEPSLPAVLALLDVPVEEAQWQGLDPPQRRQRTLDALKRLLLRESQIQPLCLALEDLHWIDSETQGFLDSSVESLPTARILLLVNYRPEYQHAWGSKTYYTQLRVDPLPPESVEELLRGLLGDDPGLGPLKQILIGQTQGNPFFLEESVRTLVETQVLVGERGAYRLAKALPTIQVPATVQAVLAARIDRLPPEDKRLLQAAAVIGEELPFPLLQAIAEEPEDALHRGLAHLKAAEFLYEARLFPDLDYTFKHGLTHQVAYGSLLQERRRALHARIVQAFERLYPDRLIEHAERLAHHAFRGEVWEKAVGYLRQAGTKAMARSANREATAYFEQALAALAHLLETRQTLEQAVDLRFDLRTSLFPLGELGRVLGYLREAEGLARGLDDQRRLGWVSVYMAHYFWVTGDSKAALKFAQSAQAIAEALGDFRLAVGANFYLGLTCLVSGDHRHAEDSCRKVVQLLEGDRQRERCGLAGFPAAMARGYLTWVLAERGAFGEGIACGQEGTRIDEALDHPYSWIVASWGLAHLHCIRGDIARAVPLLERALALCHEWNLALLQPITAGLLGSVYVLSGRIADGLSLLEEGLKAVESFQTLFVAQLSEAYMLTNRLEDALRFAKQALRLARERGQRGYEAYALRFLGEIHSGETPPDHEGAEAWYRQAMALADELEMRPLEAHCHLGLGKPYRRTGKPQEAEDHLTAAAAMYREMDMRLWLEQADAELKELG